MPDYDIVTAAPRDPAHQRLMEEQWASGREAQEQWPSGREAQERYHELMMQSARRIRKKMEEERAGGGQRKLTHENLKTQDELAAERAWEKEKHERLEYHRASSAGSAASSTLVRSRGHREEGEFEDHFPDMHIDRRGDTMSVRSSTSSVGTIRRAVVPYQHEAVEPLTQATRFIANSAHGGSVYSGGGGGSVYGGGSVHGGSGAGSVHGGSGGGSVISKSSKRSTRSGGSGGGRGDDVASVYSIDSGRSGESGRSGDSGRSNRSGGRRR